MEDYKKYKWFFTSSNALVIGGKSAAQNDLLISTLKKQDKDYVMMHTSAPGSPFTCIFKDLKKVTQEDKVECAQFTACFSQAWKSKARNVGVHCFTLSQLHKNKSMKSGTWGLKGKVEEYIIAELKLGVIKQKGILRAVPLSQNRKVKLVIKPGNIEKQDLLAKMEIEYGEPLAREEVLAALPAGGITMERK